MTLLLLAALAAGDPAGSAETVYRVNPARAEAGFDLKATLHTVHGRTKRVIGEVRSREGAGGVLALSGRIEVGAATLDTGNASRDKTMRNASLEVDTYPLIVLVPERYDPKSGQLEGALTIRDVTKPVTITMKLEPQGDRIVASGTFAVPWGDFGVPDPSFGPVRIKKVATAHFSAELVRVAP